MKYAGKLTFAAAKNLEPGQFLKCDAVKGLELRAGATAKSFSFYYRNREGVRRRPHLGNFPGLSIEGAREAAKHIIEALAKGADPSAEKAALRSAPTVNDLADKLQARADKEYVPGTAKLVERLLRHYIRPVLGEKKVASVTVSECTELLNNIAAGKIKIVAKSSSPTGKPAQTKKHKKPPSKPVERFCVASTETAKSVKTYGSKMFAIAEGDSLKWRPRNTNPFHDEETPEFPDAKRETHIAEEEFAAVNQALIDLSEAYPWHVACLYVGLYIGSRVTELATAQRSWLKRDERGNVDLILQRHKTSKKTGIRKIHITTAAAAIIAKLPEWPTGALFGPLADLKSPRRAVWAVWDKARASAKIREEVRVQDIRRTFASVARSKQGAAIGDIQSLLGHMNSKTTERYAFLFDGDKRQLADETAASIGNMLKGPSEAAGGRKIRTVLRTSALKFARVRARA